MRNGTFLTHSAEETFEFAYSLGETLTEQTIFLLNGELGAGKTVFTKGLAAGLDIDPADVTSPTFTLVNEYEGRLPLIHLDLYRLPDGIDAAMGIGLDSILLRKAVIVIEWAEKLGNFVIANSFVIDLHPLAENSREIIIRPGA